MFLYKLIFATLTVGLILIGIHHIMFNKSRRLCTVTYMDETPEESRCEMTYMFNWPEYIPIKLNESIQKMYPKYTLSMYGEGDYAEELKNLNFYSGVPILFIPGNAGTFKQVRSLATVALQKAKTESFHFIYFTVGFGREMSALKGKYLVRQTNFVHVCIKSILQLFRQQGIMQNSVLILGYSIGGLVARALFTLPDFDPSMVNTIITLATPNSMPVVLADKDIEQFYFKVNQFWYEQSKENWLNNTMRDLVIASVGGGCCDLQIRNDLISVKPFWMLNQSIDVVTTAMPKVWASSNHESIVWCKQLLLAVTRALFDIVDADAARIISDATMRVKVLRYHLETSFSGNNAYRNLMRLDSPFTSSQKENCKFANQDSFSFARKDATSCRLVNIREGTGFVLAIFRGNTDDWIAACGDGDACNILTSLTKNSKLIQVKNGHISVLKIKIEELRKFGTYLRFAVKNRNKERLHVKISREYDSSSVTLKNPFLFSSSFETIVNQKIYCKIKLPFLTCPWIAYKTNITYQCRRPPLITVHFHIPWFNEDVFYTEDNFHGISLKFTAEKPSESQEAELHLWFTSKCNFTFETKIDFLASVGQLLKFSHHEILHWMAAFSIICMVFEALSFSNRGDLNLLESMLLTLTSIIIKIFFNFESSRHSMLEHLIINFYRPAVAFGLLLSLNFIIWMILSFTKALCKTVAYLPKLLLRLCKSRRQWCIPVYVSYIMYLLDLGLPIAASIWLCGSSGILLALLFTFFKSIITDRESSQAISLCALVLVIRSPSLVAWIQDLKYSHQSDPDPFTESSICVVVAIFILDHSDLNSRIKRFKEYFILMLFLSLLLTCSFVPLYSVPDLMTLFIFLHCMFLNYWRLLDINNSNFGIFKFFDYNIIKKNS